MNVRDSEEVASHEERFVALGRGVSPSFPFVPALARFSGTGTTAVRSSAGLSRRGLPITAGGAPDHGNAEWVCSLEARRYRRLGTLYGFCTNPESGERERFVMPDP